MELILQLYKEVGETPLECLERFRAVNPAYKDLPMTYAGRLDPMAEGLLLVLAGDEVHNKDNYLKLDKTYEAEIIFGLETDTYDVLGLVKDFPIGSTYGKKEAQKILLNFLGKQMQVYPPYSSKPVDGKPLFAHAREGSLGDVEMPTHEVEIFDIKITGDRKIEKEKLLAEILEKISKVHGDFRQDEIKKRWEEVLAQKSPAPASAGKLHDFWALSLTISCSSGTYIRSLAQDLGRALGTSAILFSLKRTKLGPYSL
jgi:tRNA pseudouridine55 synthase